MTSPHYAIIDSYEMRPDVLERLTRTDESIVCVLIIDGSERSSSPPAPVRLKESPILQNYSPKHSDLFPKNDKIHWVDRQRNFRGRQHKRLIFQRTTNK